MPDYKKLVNALRCCIQNPPKTCVDCKYNIGNNECAVRWMMCDAAAAIEALQAQLPKRGEWIMDGRYSRHCSICNESVAWPEKYCPNCGAKMEVQDGK